MTHVGFMLPICAVMPEIVHDLHVDTLVLLLHRQQDMFDVYTNVFSIK